MDESLSQFVERGSTVVGQVSNVVEICRKKIGQKLYKIGCNLSNIGRTRSKNCGRNFRNLSNMVRKLLKSCRQCSNIVERWSQFVEHGSKVVEEGRDQKWFKLGDNLSKMIGTCKDLFAICRIWVDNC